MTTADGRGHAVLAARLVVGLVFLAYGAEKIVFYWSDAALQATAPGAESDSLDLLTGTAEALLGCWILAGRGLVHALRAAILLLAGYTGVLVGLGLQGGFLSGCPCSRLLRMSILVAMVRNVLLATLAIALLRSPRPPSAPVLNGADTG
jgi:hypothetical protein